MQPMLRLSLTPLPQDAAAAADTTSGIASTAYDSVWANTIPTAQAEGFEAVMLANDKLLVVMAVVFIIWLGIAWLILNTDRKLKALERTVADGIPEQDLL